jgi:hypothetical protein
MENGEGPSERDNGQVTEVANVVRIPRDWFGPREGLVPFGTQVADGESRAREPLSPTRVEAVDPNSFWDEGSGAIQDVVEAAPHHDRQEVVGATRTAGNAASWRRRRAELRKWLRRPRFVAGLVAAAALAFAGMGALGLFAAHQVSRGIGGAVGHPGEYASVASTDSIDARMVERPHVRRSLSVSHPARSTRVTHHSVSPVVVSNSTQGEPVSYNETPSVNRKTTSSGESSSYQPQPTAPRPPQRSSATAATASDSSGSSAPQPARPAPTGALTCLSNCG